MKKLFIFCLCMVGFFIAKPQSQEAGKLHETAKAFMRHGDFDNATLVLNRALQQDPQNVEILKDIALNYFLQKNYARALEAAKPLIERDDADDQCFQIAGNIYKALGQEKESEKVYRKGLKKFPQSGSLYNEYGELMFATNNETDIKQWEKGIEADPAYSSNYYNAAKYYSLKSNMLWSIIYGEIFLNLEISTGRTAEIKTLVLDNYKKLFTDPDIFINNKDKNNFGQAVLQTLYKQNSIAASGINVETLIIIRTRFILDWFNDFAAKYPFRLFDYHQQLLREGMFSAYNQWLFGPVQNPAAYMDWTTSHSNEYNDFLKFQKGRVFKIPLQQYYHK